MQNTMKTTKTQCHECESDFLIKLNLKVKHTKDTPTLAKQKEQEYRLQGNVIYVTSRTQMPCGKSNRIVVDIDLESKRELYAALARDGMTLKEWFLQNLEDYLENHGQLKLSIGKKNIK